MRPVQVLFFICVVTALSTAQDSTTNNSIDKLNIIETKPSVRLDPYIRKALLKALSALEENEEQTTGADIESTSTVNAEVLRASEDVTETLPQTKENIQIHSYIVNGQSAFNNNTSTTPALVDSKVSIISTTTGKVENQITSLPTQTPFNEIFQTKESSVNFQQVRSIQQTNLNNNSENTKPPTKLTSSAPSTTTSRPRPTTTTTTTTTTPRPTHNDDGENIEEVNKQDVQVFPAPLVAAFTVQQDAQGLPKKVIPIYHQTAIPQTITPKIPVASLPVPQQITNIPAGIPPLQNQQQQIVNRFSHNDFINQQLALQKQLEEKQRILEEQLRSLQIQQRQQEELLRKQQFLLQQKEAQRQQHLFLEHEQFKRQFLTEGQRLPNNQPPNNFQQQPQPQKNQFHLNSGAQVTIQQSVPLEQNSNLAGHQQLPNREAVDFLLHLRNQRPEQFPLQENHIPQGIANFLNPAPVVNNHFPNFNNIRPENQFPKQGNRVFRNENGVGNFGFNNQNVYRFNPFMPINNNRFPNGQQYNVDAELKQLLLQNGLNGRSQEDLNIVSKVLALNHGVSLNNNVSNRLNFGGRRHVRPF